MNRISGNGKQLCPCQCHWDLSWLKFGNSKICVGDVDGLFVVERKGYFIFIETKTINEPLTLGQEILLKELSKVNKFTVILLRGETGLPVELTIYKNGKQGAKEMTNKKLFQNRVDTWFEIANDKRVMEDFKVEGDYV